MDVRRRRCRGQASLEMLLVLLVLGALVFGVIFLGQVVSWKLALEAGTSDAARLMSLNPNLSQARQVIYQSMRGAIGAQGLNLWDVQVKLYDETGTQRWAGWLRNAPLGTRFSLEASVPFQATIPFYGQVQMTIRSQAWDVREAP